MGGGQATDQGTLTSSGWTGNVYQVMNKDHEIWHFVSSSTAPSVGLSLHGIINWDRRYKNMKRHSAGHIVDFAMHILGCSPSPLFPIKGDHDKKTFYCVSGNTRKRDTGKPGKKVHLSPTGASLRQALADIATGIGWSGCRRGNSGPFHERNRKNYNS
ncbi:hypothetical protein A3D77_04915 [Candidatus Gottesmanbacteria bacterium RIFCSPHIGHO2_02_FULL_39_11]|uniref:Uncharacterized protein n=1 Tax=Candidatus Gottesmanbacteria bacterium RIFCSPHIGHO2_02_FULL_39_11 TaxID=1798382 RepID=A0A1F5ZLP6_9BACT|nr:MAG: hypothetical protein A3D77_04915 [Candidatus Gottesmanbacteria bacterium RIFCSPHIGHO2_02_FULL_39_11]